MSALWVLALYWKALSTPFIYDDVDQIVNNPALASLRLTFHRFWLAPVSFNSEIGGVGTATYRPLYWMSLALDRRIWGMSAGGFHFTNLVLHWLNGMLGFLLLRRLRVAPLTAAVAAMLWLGLPINTEAVAWVSGRGYVLCTFFLLLALVAADGFLREGKSRLLLAAYFVASLAALLSHEEGVLILPLALLMAFATDRLSRRLAGGLVAASVLSGLIYIALRESVKTGSGHTTAALWAVGLAFWKYLLWMVLPVHMSVERSTSMPPNAASAATIAGWLGLAGLVAATVLLRKRVPKVSAGLVWILIALLPFCGFIYIYQGMAERFEYLAAAGLTLAVASLALEYAGPWKRVAVGCLVVWVLWGAWRLWERVLDWQSPAALYASSLEATPRSPVLLYNLGLEYRRGGDVLSAAKLYGEAVKLQPRYARALTGLGDVFLQLGETRDAVKYFERALAVNPADKETVIDLGEALQRMGDKQGAEVQLRRAIALDPGQSEAYTDLGVLLGDVGRVDEAIQCFQSAIKNDPSDATPYFDLAVLFQQRGQDEVALPFYRKVLELKPGDPDTIRNVSKLHLGR
ncbi:tetratricopeptide repeat protein [Edaphobacter paludis]|uniref:Tetratricopeptide repeat protein n=1 Tax=Edaphobacter paludis TaxID=3035702 RepID=A0AAU7CW00_9BACT